MKMERNQGVGFAGGGFEEEYLDKSLYICTCEFNDDCTSAYAIHAIKIRDLITSPSPSSRLDRVGYLTAKTLPSTPSCGVCGSKIIFAGGRINRSCSKDSYAFSIRDPNKEIVKLPGKLNDWNEHSVMVDVAGQLYILTSQWPLLPRNREKFVSFQVYDPNLGTWSVQPDFTSRCFRVSYAVANGCLFASDIAKVTSPSGERLLPKYCDKGDPVCCFDPKEGEWRRVPTMCQGGSFPFLGHALVVDLPQHRDKKLLFATGDGVEYSVDSVLVYLMSLDKNRESLAQIAKINLPERLRCHSYETGLFYLGGNNVCLVGTNLPHEDEDEDSDSDDAATSTVKCAAIPFRFEFDITKAGTKRKRNCFAAEFQPRCSFEYHSSSDSHVPPQHLGCFVL